MFSASVEVVLHIAFREAVSRRHAYLTLEHLLYALAHDPDGERILAACGADLGRLRQNLDRYLDESIEQFGARQGARARADGGVPSRAADRRPARAERAAAGGAGRRPARGASCSSRRRHAAQLLAEQGVTRLDILEYISHGITKTPTAASPEGAAAWRRRRDRRGGTRHGEGSAVRVLREPDGARARRPARSADRPRGGAAAHHRGPLPAPQEQPGVRRRRRRRQDGDGRRSGDAAARRRRPGAVEGRGGLLARHRRAARRHAFPRRFRGALQGGDQRAHRAAQGHPLHRRDSCHRRRRRRHRRHDGSRDADEAAADRRRSARHRLDDVRGVQAHRKGSRAREAAAEDRDRRADRSTRPCGFWPVSAPATKRTIA